MVIHHIMELFSDEQLVNGESVLSKEFVQSWRDKSSHFDAFVEEMKNENVGCVMIGPDHCAKLTLLFQYAYNLVNQNLDRDPSFQVVFICSRNIPAPHIHQVSDEDRHIRILSMIKMKYIESSLVLTQYLSNLHLLSEEQLPRFLFLSNFSSMFSSVHETAVDDEEADELNTSTDRMLDAGHLKLFALLQNTGEFLALKFTSKQAPSHFTPSFMLTDKPTSQPFFDRWCETMITIQEATSENHLSHNTFSIQFEKLYGVVDPRRQKLTYQLNSGSIEVVDFDFALLPEDEGVFIEAS